MMRFATTIATGAGILFTVPALTGQDRVTSLEEALSETVRALEMFTDISERVESDPDAVRALRLFSEEPVEDERGRDERLFELRQDVNQLQIKLDAVEGGAVLRPGAQPDLAQGSPLGTSRTPAGTSAIETGVLPPWEADAAQDTPNVGGLKPETLALLGGIHAPGSAAAQKSDTPKPTKKPSGPVESEGYSADPLRQARACLRAGLHDKGLALLDSLEESPDVLFWRGRFFEELDRTEDAIAAFDAALRAAPDSPVGTSASERLGFLTWKRDFTKSLPKSKAGAAATQPKSGGKPQ